VCVVFGFGLDDRYYISGRGSVFYPPNYVKYVLALAQSHFQRLLILGSLSGVTQCMYEVELHLHFCNVFSSGRSCKLICLQVIKWLGEGELAIGLSLWMAGFSPRRDHLGFVVEKVALGWAFLKLLVLSPVSIIPPVLHTHSFIYHQCCII
jgi:hypothetical protein